MKWEAENRFYQNHPAGLTRCWPAPRIVTYPRATEFRTAWRQGRIHKCLNSLISYQLESCPHRKLAPAEFKSAVNLCMKLNQCKPMCSCVIVMYLQTSRETGMGALFSPPFLIFYARVNHNFTFRLWKVGIGLTRLSYPRGWLQLQCWAGFCVFEH